MLQSFVKEKSHSVINMTITARKTAVKTGEYYNSLCIVIDNSIDLLSLS